MNIIQTTSRARSLIRNIIADFLVREATSQCLLSPVFSGRKTQSSYNEEYPMGNFFYTQKSMMGILRVLALFFLSSAVFFPTVAFAADFSVTPAVIDGKGKAREILRYTITVENTSDHLISLYPWVTDLDKTAGVSVMEDLGNARNKEAKESLARWIEVTRGVIDLLPGDRKEIPVLVQIHLNASPGLYHATIHFSHGSATRSEAEANTANTLETAVNIEVLEDRNIRLQLGGFLADKNFFVGDKATFSYSVENIGNRGVQPDGKIRIFDRKGEEIADIDANDTGKKIEPTEKAQLGAVWAANGEFGRYKAMLDLEYGDRGTIQDTVFFWVLPWGRILSYFLTLVTLSIIAALLIHSRVSSQRQLVFHSAPASLEENIRVHHERQKYTQRKEERSPAHRPVREHTRTYHTPAPSTPQLKNFATSGHRIRIPARPKPVVDPLHIVNLKRMS